MYNVYGDIMHKFPSIEQFRHVIKNVEFRTRFTGELSPEGYPILHDKEDVTMPVLRYNGTVKLHGTNSSVVRPPEGALTTQSRERVVTPEDDNYGFSRWAYGDIPESVWVHLFESMFSSDDLANNECVIFGEWCGKGIQKTVGISQLDKMFVIFGAKMYTPDGSGDEWILSDDMTKDTWSAPEHNIFNIYHFPAFDIDIDFSNPKIAADHMTTLVKQVEDSCPVASALGAAGIGEGIVWRCTAPGWESSKYWFKTKGDKHKVTKEKKKIPIDVEKAASIDDFVTRTVTEARCIQAINDQNLALTRKSTGAFLKWLGQDILKEDKDTLEASGLSWKEVVGTVNKTAKNWFFDYVDHEAGL